MRIILLAPLVLLAACSGAEEANNQPRDPVAAAALDDPLMTDPDLTGQNQGNAALHGGLPDGAMPPFKGSAEEIAAAKLEAERLLGKPIPAAPEAGGSTKTSRLAGAATMQAVAQAAGLGGDCAGKLEYSAIWAARLPRPLPLYPRGHTQVAGGSDQAGCRLRAVRYVTPVDPGDVIAFYHASASAAKMPATRSREGEDEVLSGKGFALFVRKRGDGLSEVDLVTSGL
ncbi:MAG: hypothetical protein KGZ65_01960 [Sphingomonadales bacterium]|nr:hypothetical protein [Sphingomonadaceae bacterium]MBS3929970.1 hypothetical protein [Sphingomonadales bacterium]